MKKMKFTFWLLGFGCGMAFTGIVGTYFALNIQGASQNEKMNEIVKDENTIIVETEVPPISKEKTVAISSEVTDVKEQVDAVEQQKVQLPSDQPEVSMQADTVDKDKVTEEPVKEEKYKTITIAKAASASEICKQLEEEGFIDSADDFLAYIKSHKKQRFLKHGTFSLPLNVDHERLLEELTV